jgi:hypothetical protein
MPDGGSSGGAPGAGGTSSAGGAAGSQSSSGGAAGSQGSSGGATGGDGSGGASAGSAGDSSAGGSGGNAGGTGGSGGTQAAHLFFDDFARTAGTNLGMPVVGASSWMEPQGDTAILATGDLGCDGACWVAAGQGMAFGFGARLRLRLTFNAPGAMQMFYDSVSPAIQPGGLGLQLAQGQASSTLCIMERNVVLDPCASAASAFGQSLFVELTSTIMANVNVNLTVGTGNYVSAGGTVLVSSSKVLMQGPEGGQFVVINFASEILIEEIAIDEP